MNGTLFIDERLGENAPLIKAFGDVLTGPFFLLDDTEQLVGCNGPALGALGVSSLEEARALAEGKVSPLFLKEKGLFTPDKALWMGPLGEGIPIVALQKKGESPCRYRLRVEPVEVKENRYYLLHLNDVEEVQRAKKARHYFETFKQQFLTNISHEFRTPMNSIIGFTGLLEQTDTDPQQREYIAHIQHSAGNMLENVENLLELMQIESGTQQVRRDAFKVYDEFEGFLLSFCHTAEEKKINLFYMLDPSLPESMIADSEKIKKILRNLISNAIKFTPEGGQILVEIKVVELGRRTLVRYSVSDTGEGIAKDKLQTILRPFAATQQNRVRGKEGFGIGLTLAFKLLKILGGELSVSSEVGKGSRFAFTLTHARISPAPFKLMQGSRIALWCENPADVIQQKILKKYLKLFGIDALETEIMEEGTLRGMDALFMISRGVDRQKLEMLGARYPDLQIVPVVSHENEALFRMEAALFSAVVTYPLLPTKVHSALSVIWKHVPKALLKPEPPVEAGDDKRKILIVEDNQINQKLILTILEQQGYEVMTADDGAKGVDCYESNMFDMVLMDIDMPVMDGVQATQHLRQIDREQKRPFTPVLALTARAMAGERERIIGAGLDAHLAKPVEREFLIDTIERFMKMKDERNKKLGANV